MPSASLTLWQTKRAATLDEIEAAHIAVGGLGRGRRYATQQVNHAYVVLLSGQFQGFCRDLHSECVRSLVAPISPTSMRSIVSSELSRSLKLNTGNPNPGNLGADFGRLGIDLWPAVLAIDRRNKVRQRKLEELNRWRNAIAHQDFDPSQLGGTISVQLRDVQAWRGACEALAIAFDVAMRLYINHLFGISPWKE